MAHIRIGAETESTGAWHFDVSVTTESGPARQITARLAWPDYDHWTGGSIPPATLIEHITRYLVDHTPPADLPDSFDAASVRRRYPKLAEYLQAHLEG